MVINRTAHARHIGMVTTPRARLVLGAAGIVILAATFAALDWSRARMPRERGPVDDVYRYPFERTTRGRATEVLEQEIAFYQKRIQRDAEGGLDLASLAGVYLKKARLTGQTHWYLLAEHAARRSIANLPFYNDGAVLALAKVAEARHDFEEAIRLARSVAAREEAFAIITSASLAMGRLNDAASAADTLVARAPTLSSYGLRALVHLARGRDVKADADFRRALAAEQPGEQGSSAWVRTLMGRSSMRRGRVTDARELLAEALRILPQYAPALIHLAELETKLGRYVEAEQMYWKVLAVSPGASYPLVYDHVAMQGLARARALQGDRDPAEALWSKAEMMIRGHLNAFGHRRELARLLLERGRGADVAEALSLMQMEVRLRRDAETLDIFAWALSRAGKWREANGVVREAIATGVRDAALFHRAGVIAQALGRPRAAAHWLGLAHQTDAMFDERLWALGLR